ncbi:BolA family protein [Tepidicaulis sp.]|uniref:BolA family protein n=1 Tax=Tepidicaulis sp. TaxID=1920809 RepID=UPI003B5C0636
MGVAETMRNLLETALAPEVLEISDQSAKHKGHAGARPEGETHFNVFIVSPAFDGKSRIERHRMVNKAVAALMDNPVHALAVKAQTPAEAAQG